MSVELLRRAILLDEGYTPLALNATSASETEAPKPIKLHKRAEVKSEVEICKATKKPDYLKQNLKSIAKSSKLRIEANKINKIVHAHLKGKQKQRRTDDESAKKKKKLMKEKSVFTDKDFLAFDK